MKMHSLALLACLFAAGAGRRVNYCGARMCRNTDAHTFCQYPPGPSAECTGYIDARLSKDEKSRILSRLNRRRSDAASGRLRGLSSAGDMLKLRWIEELAKEAELWANQCRPPSSPEERDECRDLYSTSVGQCIASVVGEAPGLRVESMVDMWYMQSLLYKGNVSSYIPPESEQHFYGDFGQMLWARSYMVGCGRSRFMVPRYGRLRSVERLVCNFAPAGPAPYRALWSRAASASDCPPRSRPDQAIPGLCNYQLQMNVSDMVNNTMSIQEHVLLNTAFQAEKNESFSGIGSIDELYLTNLAIVTMEIFESSTSMYNSIKKRDIVQPVDASNYYVNVRDKHKKTKLNEFNKIHKKKISTIGRPKTYNMAELTEIGDDHKEENFEVEDVTKNIIDMYSDYNIIDSQEEENETLTTEGTNLTNDHALELFDSFDRKNKNVFTNVLLQTTTNENMVTVNKNTSGIENTLQLQIDLETNVTDLNLNLNKTSIPNEKSAEDYNDPETVRQLQEALERMEHEKESANKIKSKVRRELRDDTQYDDGSSSTASPAENQNTTQDRGPMLNMVMKYMPLLKDYESQILGKRSSAESLSSNGLVWFLYFCKYLSM